MRYLVPENPFRDRKENDEYIDIRLDATEESEAVGIATEMAEKHQLTYWEVSKIVQVAFHMT